VSEVGTSPYSVCAAVLAVVHDALKRCNREPACSTIAAGGLIFDSCEGGYLIVAPERVYRVGANTPFPGEAALDLQVAGLAVEVVVRIERCVPVLTDAGQAPPIAEQEAAFREVLADAAVVWSACASDAMLAGQWERANLDQVFVGPVGACCGSETRFTIGLDADEWCIDCPPTYLGEP
jgi:hypothetical protein